MDERPQIQVLHRSAPMMPGVPERRSFDYVQHGTVDLAALDIATGHVLGKVTARHTAAGFRDFLADLDAVVSASLDVHALLNKTTAWQAA